MLSKVFLFFLIASSKVVMGQEADLGSIVVIEESEPGTSREIIEYSVSHLFIRATVSSYNNVSTGKSEMQGDFRPILQQITPGRNFDLAVLNFQSLAAALESLGVGLENEPHPKPQAAVSAKAKLKAFRLVWLKARNAVPIPPPPVEDKNK